jgi:transcriptional regulator with XRE-family HTH domain
MEEVMDVDRSINSAFGQRVRVAMAVARISRQEVAQACGVSPQAVQRWCDGTSYPAASKLMTFCDMTGCSAEWLLCPHPVDIRSTDWAINGTHIKNIVRQVMDELAATP